MSKHPIVHVEFSAKDRKAAQKFYGDLFGWSFTHYDDMHYTTFDTGGVAGGISDVSEENPAGRISFYIQTDDVTATLKRIEEAGGKVAMPETEIPGTGTFGFFQDPTGNVIGLINLTPPPAS
jgi:uncharacterized protein